MLRRARPQGGTTSGLTWGFRVARLAGFEPAAGCLEGSCSVQLSYRRPQSIVHDRRRGQASSERIPPRRRVRQSVWQRAALREAPGLAYRRVP